MEIQQQEHQSSEVNCQKFSQELKNFFCKIPVTILKHYEEEQQRFIKKLSNHEKSQEQNCIDRRKNRWKDLANKFYGQPQNMLNTAKKQISARTINQFQGFLERVNKIYQERQQLKIQAENSKNIQVNNKPIELGEESHSKKSKAMVQVKLFCLQALSQVKQKTKNQLKAFPQKVCAKQKLINQLQNNQTNQVTNSSLSIQQQSINKLKIENSVSTNQNLKSVQIFFQKSILLAIEKYNKDKKQFCHRIQDLRLIKSENKNSKISNPSQVLSKEIIQSSEQQNEEVCSKTPKQNIQNIQAFFINSLQRIQHKTGKDSQNFLVKIKSCNQSSEVKPSHQTLKHEENFIQQQSNIVSEQIVQTNNTQKSPKSNEEQEETECKRKYSASSFSEEKILKKKLQKEKLQQRIEQLDVEIQQLQNQLEDHPQQTVPNSRSNSKEKQHKYRFLISNDRDAQQKAIELVKKMNRQRQEQKMRQIEIRQKKHEKFFKQLDEAQQISLEQHLKLQQERLQQRQKKLEKISEKQIIRQQIDKETNDAFKEFELERNQNQNQNPNQNQKVLQKNIISPMSELEKKKYMLVLKRQLNNPKMNVAVLPELNQQQHYGEDLHKQIESLEIKLDKIKKIPVYIPQKSQITDRIIQMDKKEKNRDIINNQQKVALAQKSRQYSKLVKDIYVPISKPVTELEQESIFQSQQNQQYLKKGYGMKKFYSPQVLASEHQGIGIDNDDYNNEVNSRENYSSVGQQPQKLRIKKLKYNNKSIFNEQDFKSQGSKNKQGQELIYSQSPNYQLQLQLIKEKNEKLNEIESNQINSNDQNLNQEHNSVSDKLQQLRQNVKLMENYATKKEQNIFSYQDLKEIEQTNNQYINSIKAKLALLKQINQ